VPIANVPPRIVPFRSKQTNGKINLSKVRPATAPLSKPPPPPPTNNQSRTQRLVPIVLPPSTRIRPKPPVSTNRRSSFGPTISSTTSNLERQSTSTGGSTSSLSSTNTQASIPCTRSETPTSSILRSVSNDIISTPNSININPKSRIPIRTIPIAIIKKSST
jgi:hypothetical protein